MLNKFQIFIIAIILILPFQVIAQSDSNVNNLRLESGLGVGVIGSAFGVNFDVNLNYLSNNWGGEIRHIYQAGKTLASGNFFSTHYVVKEHFVENAILLSRLIKQTNNLQYVASAGIGLISQKDSEIRFRNELGFAYDIGLKKTGKFFGYASSFFGNINSKETLIGLSFSMTLNLSW